MWERLAGLSRKLSFLAFVFWSALIGFKINSIPDYWWQLEEGQRLLAGGKMAGPLHAFGFPAVPYPSEYGLYECSIGLLFQAGGHWLIWAVFGTVFSGLLIFFLWLIRGLYRTGDGGLVPLSAIFLVFQKLFCHRPEMIGVAAMFLMGLILVYQEKLTGPVRVWFWPLLGGLLVVWSNSHSSYILGVGLLGLWSIWRLLFGKGTWPERWKNILPAAGIGILAPFLHPDSWRNVLRPFLHQYDQVARDAVPEMWPPTGILLGSSFIFLFFGLGLLFLTPGLLRRQGWIALLLPVLFGLAMMSARHVIFLAVAMTIALLAIVENGSWPKYRLPAPLAAAVHITGAAVLGIFLAWFGNSMWKDGLICVERATNASAALEWLSQRSPVPVFFVSEWHPASYAQTFAGRLRPFQDSGLARFSQDSTQYYDQLQTRPEALRYALDHLGVDAWLVNSLSVQWLWILAAPDSGWVAVYADANSIIFTRKGGDFSGPAVPIDDQWRSQLRQFSGEDNFSLSPDRVAWNEALLQLSRSHAGRLPIKALSSEEQQWLVKTTDRLNQRIKELREQALH